MSTNMCIAISYIGFAYAIGRLILMDGKMYRMAKTIYGLHKRISQLEGLSGSDVTTD